MAITLSITSCSSRHYMATSQNVQVFDDEKQLVISGDVCNNLYPTGLLEFESVADVSGSAGYSFHKNIGVISSYRPYRNPISKNLSSYLFENELVLFKTDHHNWSPALNIGFGIGEIHQDNQDYTLNLSRQFVQPSIGYKYDWFQFTVSSRLTKANWDLYIDNPNQDNDYFILEGLPNQDVFFIEPAATMGFEKNDFTFTLQYSKVFQLSNTDVRFNPSSFFVGLKHRFEI